MGLKVGASTDTGRKRTQNQDSFIALPEIGLFVVADGMGGHQGGQTASQLATETVAKQIKKTQKEMAHWPIESTLTEAIHAANQAIFQRSSSEPALQGMGTTVTALLFKDHSLCIAQVGDSRCYLLRDHGFWQTTRDHSLVEEKYRAGLISREQVKSDRMRNVITRSVGFEPQVEVETYSLECLPGDVFLICSDGLSGMIDDPLLFKLLEEWSKKGPPPQEIAEALTREANAQGGDDNITSLVVQVT